MRDRMERFVILPFSVGCISQSSVAVGGKKIKQEPNNPSTSEEESLSGGKMKNSFGFLPFQKPNFSFGLQRLIKGVKSFSQLFVYKEEEEDEEMEIGFPTDVKHVTHIGWDGSTTTNTTIKGWDDLKAPELLSLTPISLRQFELAMGAQSDAHLFH